MNSSVVKSEFEGMAPEEWQRLWERLRDNVLRIDAELASRNRINEDTGRRMTDFEYHRWRRRAVQQKTDDILQMQELKRLLVAHRQQQPQSDNHWWRDRALDLKQALEQILQRPKETFVLAQEACERFEEARGNRELETHG